MRNVQFFLEEWVTDNDDVLSLEQDGETLILKSRIPLLFKLEVDCCVLHYQCNVCRIHFFNISDCDNCLLYMESMTKSVKFPTKNDYKITISSNRGNREVILYGKI